MVCLPRKKASKVSCFVAFLLCCLKRSGFYSTYSASLAAAAVMRKTVGRNLPFMLLTRNSGPASMLADIYPFSALIRELLLGQEVLRCPQAALVHCLQNEKGVMALVGHLMAQALTAVCGSNL